MNIRIIFFSQIQQINMSTFFKNRKVLPRIYLNKYLDAMPKKIHVFVKRKTFFFKKNRGTVARTRHIKNL